MLNITNHSVQFNSVAQSCPTFCDPMNCSMPGLLVHHQGKCKSIPQRNATSHSLKWVFANKKKNKKKTKVESNKFDENGEKLEPVCSAGKSIKWCSHYDSSLKN